jgi:hypothetical protein
MAAFQFIFKWGNIEVGWVRDDSHVVLGRKNYLVKKEV